MDYKSDDMKKVLSYFIGHWSFYSVCLFLVLLVSVPVLVRVNASSTGDAGYGIALCAADRGAGVVVGNGDR